MMLEPALTNDWLSFEQFKIRYINAAVEESPNNVMETVQEPLISIVIVTYQHAKYIANAIEGVLMQKTDFPLEIILGDDDSTDGTREICIEYAARFPDKIRLFLHRRENNIKVLNRSTGIFQIAFNLYQCRGKYIALTSGDDYWQDDSKLQRQVDYLEKDQSASFTYHDCFELFESTGRIKGPFTKKSIQSIVGRNIFPKLPREFLKIMQEDTFLKFFWNHVGNGVHLPTIDPVVIRFHCGNMFRSLENQAELEQKMNLLRNLRLVCEQDRRLSDRVERKLAMRTVMKVISADAVPAYKKPFAILTELRKERILYKGFLVAMEIIIKNARRLFPQRAGIA